MGTDIRLEFTLEELSEFDNTAIKQLRCYIIRKEDVQYIDLDNFGYPQYYSPTEYDLMYTCSYCNRYRYNWLPYNQEVFNSGMFGPIDDYRYFPTYNGFGVRSKQFKIIPDKYLAASKVLEKKNTIEMYFPADDQRQFGEYIVVIVVTVYQPGWGSNNLRTYTINKGVQFELVDEYKNKEDDLQLGETVEYDGYKFESKKVLAKYKSKAPDGYHKVVEIDKSRTQDNVSYESIVKDVKLIQNGNIYSVIKRDSNTLNSIIITLNGNDVTSQCGPNSNGIYSFTVDKDGYSVINQFDGRYVANWDIDDVDNSGWTD